MASSLLAKLSTYAASRADRPRFENSVRNGKNQMPPWRDVLSEADIDAVWIYIRAHAYKK
jgi:mono/diheme cytochrome c family protein